MPVGCLPFFYQADDENTRAFYRRIGSRMGKRVSENANADELMAQSLETLGQMIVGRMQALSVAGEEPTKIDWLLVAVAHVRWIDEVTDKQREQRRG